MSRVTIVLEDNEEGTVNQTVSYEMNGNGGFDDNSQAHQYSRVMLKFGSDIATSDTARKGVSGKSEKESGIILLG
jgi:hypothetical protein